MTPMTRAARQAFPRSHKRRERQARPRRLLRARRDPQARTTSSVVRRQLGPARRAGTEDFAPVRVRRRLQARQILVTKRDDPARPCPVDDLAEENEQHCGCDGDGTRACDAQPCPQSLCVLIAGVDRGSDPQQQDRNNNRKASAGEPGEPEAKSHGAISLESPNTPSSVRGA